MSVEKAAIESEVLQQAPEQLGLLGFVRPDCKEQEGVVETEVALKSSAVSAQVVEKPQVAPRLRDSSSRQLAPMLQQYVDVKRQYENHLLFFQVGDFYEVFFADAPIVAENLNIRLTSRDKVQDDPIPMCGVPIHAFDNYLPKLLSKGFSAVVVSQVEDAKKAKGMVRREITRIVTPGVRFEGDGLEETKFNFLAAACLSPGDVGAVAYIDVSTGHLRLAQVENLSELSEILLRINPSELIMPSTLFEQSVDKRQRWFSETKRLAAQLNCAVTLRPFGKTTRQAATDRLAKLFAETATTSYLKQAEEEIAELGGEALSALETALLYVEEVSFSATPRVANFAVVRRENAVFLDAATRRNLELTEARIDGDRKNSLIHRLDYSKTAMGSRLLTEWLNSPGSDLAEINARHDALEEFISRPDILEKLRQSLEAVRDIDRLVSRITGFRAMPRDLGTLRDSLAELPAIADLLAELKSSLLATISGEFDPLVDISQRLLDALQEDSPVRINEGGIFRPGFHAEIDRLREIRTDGRSWLAKLEKKERERTGIGTGLKVKYNNVFGYFIEVTKAHLGKTPADYERKQTLVNAERFVTQELKEHEVEILSAKSRQIDLERDLFVELRQWVAEAAGRIQLSSYLLGQIDVITSLAHAAVVQNYTRPIISESSETLIIGGRHPVAEMIMGQHNFIPNDVRLNCDDRRFAVLTGPNMGGKSTYLRQVGLIQLMAQIGSFVPAERAELGLVDRIFTRIGAADDLSRGDSTFMVEMREAATIVRRATSRSMVLIDEIGRGTATSDGLAIATAISEWLIDNIACRTVFATHFHELTTLPETKTGAFCLAVGVIEDKNEIIFTHRIEEKAADRSYGIEVARLAGLPENLLRRADELLVEHASSAIGNAVNESVNTRSTKKSGNKDDAAVSALRVVGEKLRGININGTTPFVALALLAELKQDLEK